MELVDVLRSGRSVRKDVGVRIPPSAPLPMASEERTRLDASWRPRIPQNTRELLEYLPHGELDQQQRHRRDEHHQGADRDSIHQTKYEQWQPRDDHDPHAQGCAPR